MQLFQHESAAFIVPHATRNRFKCKQGSLAIPPTGTTYENQQEGGDCHLLPYGDEQYYYIEERI